MVSIGGRLDNILEHNSLVSLKHKLALNDDSRH